jgi:prevent-host-death family protein
MYMKVTVGVGELRQNLSKFLRRVERGERLVVTDRNRPVAELAPLPDEDQSAVQRLVAEGRATPAVGALDFKPIKLKGRYPASDALRHVRGD